MGNDAARQLSGEHGGVHSLAELKLQVRGVKVSERFF
jgi:hypothetical protein